MSRFTAKIPTWAGGGFVRGSERAYVTFLNKLRADVFDAFAAVAHPDGTMTPSDAKAIANAVNVMTGRGKIGTSDKASAGLNAFIFSPKYVASGFNLLFGQPFYHGSKDVKKAVAGEYARFLVGAGIMYALASMTLGDDDKIETDPRSSDFGKIKYGNTRLNPLGGLIQNTVLASRVFSGETKTLGGDIKSIRADKKYGSPSAWDVIANFARTKLAPVPSAIVNIASGQNIVGEKVTPEGEIGRLGYPLSLRDIYDAMLDQGVAKGTALSLASLFGMGLSSYEPRTK